MKILKDSTITGLSGDIITSEYIKQSIQELDTALTTQISTNSFENVGISGLLDSSKVSVYLSGTDKDTVNVDVVSGSYDYYINGVLTTITQNKTIQLLGTPTRDNGLHYVYFSDSEGTLTVSNTAWNLFNHVPLALVFWYQGNAEGGRALIGDEKHTCAIPKMVHKILHTNQGTRKVSGGIVSGHTLDTATNSATTFGISETVINDEDIFITLNALVDGNGTGENYSFFHHANGTTMAFTLGKNVPVLHATNGRVYYDGLSNGLTELSNNYFTNYYLWATNFSGEARFALMPSQSQFTTQNDAQAETLDALNLTLFPTKESVCIAQITIETKDAYTNLGKFRIKRIQPISVSLTSVSSTINTLTGNLVSLTTTGYAGLLTSAINNVQLLSEKIDVLGKVKSVSTNTTLTDTDNMVLVDTTTGDVTITLANASQITTDVIIKKIASANNLFIVTTSSQTIDGSTSITVTSLNSAIHLRTYNSNYYII